MILRDWLKAQRLTAERFAELVQAHPVTVRKWCNFLAEPGGLHCARIEVITHGQVMAVDLVAPGALDTVRPFAEMVPAQ